MAYRKIHINGDIWEYSIGSGVKIKSNKVKSVWVKIYKVAGMIKEEYIEKKETIMQMATKMIAL